ncbi:hypothetical protein HAHI6034_03785 [Hathewaya histolytica]|uniref:Uncharacterized protein n=1 Tax=Hathewaya histolytica TaxID=1498 RepID=A0A4U9R4D0_HATHI|nr:Uncharacterised protein [Hathewaya histolytica]
MSRHCRSKRKHNCCCMPMMPYPSVSPASYGADNYGDGGSCCNFPCFIILILILLQFGRKERRCDDECRDGLGIDKGILFIIALFYLSCCNPCR